MFNEELKNKNLIVELESFEKILEREIIIRNWKEIELPSEKAKILAPIDVNVSLWKIRDRLHFLHANLAGFLVSYTKQA